MNKRALRKELKKVRKQEDKFVYRSVKSQSLLSDFVNRKMPAKIHNTLLAAFGKAFEIIYIKGSKLINKTYDKENMKKDYKADERFARAADTRLGIKSFHHKSFRRSILDGGIVTGAAFFMGLVGASLPDIPLFVSVAIRNMNQTCLCYGYDCENLNEKVLMVKMMGTALIAGDEAEAGNGETDDMIEFIEQGGMFTEEDLKAESKKASDRLSDRTLYMKFLMQIPIFGAIFGLCDFQFFSKIHRYVDMKYRERFLREALGE